jgi:ADP-L-glycero-D-manno-heptose 6-epimerase
MIIVTGGAGFIGSNLVRGLNERGYTDILIVDDLTDGSKHKNMNRLQFSDYMDYNNFLDDIENHDDVEIIFHQGACSDTTEANGSYMMDTNYEYSKALLAFAMQNDARFIYASSASVYGNGENGFKEALENEYPLNVYAFSKYQFDRVVRANMDDFPSQVVGLRYFNVYGPQENHKGRMASVAYQMFKQVKAGAQLRLFEGSDGFTRDFVHVDDIVKINLFFMEHPELSGIFNAGTGRNESFAAIAKAVMDFYPGTTVEEIPFPDDLKGKYQTYTKADLTALTEAGYADSFMTVAEGVKKYLEVLEKTGGYLV